MKFFYKILGIVLFAGALLFDPVLTQANETIFYGVPTISKTGIREAVKEEAIASLRVLVQRTRNKDSEQILRMLENGTVVIPTKDGWKAPAFQKEDGIIKIVVLIPTDAQYPLWYALLTDQTAFAYFFPGHHAIVLKQSSDFCQLFRAIAIDHEGWHARYFQKHPESKNASDIQFAMEERDTHEHGNELLSVVGGAPYQAFLESEIKRWEPLITTENSKQHFPSPTWNYNNELEKIFGPAKSQAEKNFRKSFVWADTLFHYIDAHHRGTQAEKEQAKAEALLEAYKKIGMR